MRTRILPLVVLILFLAGCKQSEPSQTDLTDSLSVSTVPTTLYVEPETIETTAEPTTEPTIPALDISAGSYLEKFEDPQTDTYMDYYAFIPENAVENMPLIIFLHGDGEVGNVHALERNPLILKTKEIYGEEFPFIVISPCTRVKTWIDGTVPTTLKNLIDNAIEKFLIDPKHVIITGHSRGAVGVWYMINVYGDFFSAAVPVSCYSWRPLDENVITQVPIRAFCGNVDWFEVEYFYALTNQTETIRSWGGDAELTLHNGAMHYETPALSFTPELFEWMLSK